MSEDNSMHVGPARTAREKQRDAQIQHLRRQLLEEERRPGFRLYHNAEACELTETDVEMGAEYEGAEAGEYPLAKLVDSFESIAGTGVCHVFECPKCGGTFVAEFGTR